MYTLSIASAVPFIHWLRVTSFYLSYLKKSQELLFSSALHHLIFLLSYLFHLPIQLNLCQKETYPTYRAHIINLKAVTSGLNSRNME